MTVLRYCKLIITILTTFIYLLTFNVNGRKINLSDDVIIRGVGADDGVKKSILGQFTYISLGEVELFKGENVIKITQKNFADYCDLASDHSGNRYASTKVDAIEIYLHSTDKMQKEAARSIDLGIRGMSSKEKTSEELNTDGAKTQPKQKFEPVKGKYRKPGTGCITKLNDHLWEGCFTPTVNGKRMPRNVYAHTEEECEAKLAKLIREMKAEIEKLKQGG